jgi:hypothetical protein
MHLGAVQHVLVPVPANRGRDRVDVRARTLLGDRVALVPLAADRRDDPSFELLGSHDGGRPCRRGVDAPPERVGHPAELLGDERLLEHGHPGAAELLGHVHREETELDRQAVVPLPRILGDQSLVLLGVHLPRDQFVVDETPRSQLDLAIVV